MVNIFSGKHYFNEFLQENPKIGNNALSQTLSYMETKWLIKKTVENEKNTHYELTDKGKKSNRILYELAYYTLDEDLTDECKKAILKDFKKNLGISDSK